MDFNPYVSAAESKCIFSETFKQVPAPYIDPQTCLNILKIHTSYCYQIRITELASSFSNFGASMEGIKCGITPGHREETLATLVQILLLSAEKFGSLTDPNTCL